MPIPFAHSAEVTHTVEILDRLAPPPLVDRALRAAGLSRKLLASEPGFVPYAAEAALLESAARSLGERHLGALVGRAWDYSTYRGYARYVLGAPNLAGALDRSRRALPLLHPGSEVAARTSGGHLVIGFSTGLRSVVGHRHVDDGAIFVMDQVLRHFLGSDWRPDWIEVAGACRANLNRIEEIASVPVLAGAETPAIAVPIEALFVPNPDPPGAAEAVTLGELPLLMGVARPRTVTDAVGHMLRMQFTLGDMSVEAVARRLSLGPRTLQRILKSEGTSFREVRARFIEDRARALLAESELSIDDIARSVGYDEPNSFRRAFRGWTGRSPSAFRANASVA